MIKRVAGIFVLLLAISCIAYPLVSEHFNSARNEAVFTRAETDMQETDEEVISASLSAARQYNKALASGAATESNYNDLLNLSGDGIMCFLEIPSIDVKLPVYHGSGEDVLQKGLGHMEGTSLPVGGEGTHVFVSGHTGMNNVRMLTDLANVEIGDLFCFHTLGKALMYRVSDIRVVLPTDDSVLTIEPNEDKASIITCTPYGVNSHRLIVTGTRVPDEEAETVREEFFAQETHSSQWSDQYLRALFAGAGIFAGVLFAVFALRKMKAKRKKQRP